jgi:hypothetical protein
MNLLIVEAAATTGQFFVPDDSILQNDTDLAAPIIAVSVMTSDGTPVGGLGEKNFAVRFLVADQTDPAFIQATVKVAKEQVPGLYVLALQPAKAVTPPKACAKYLYAVAVKRSSKAGDHGQTLTSLEWC